MSASWYDRHILPYLLDFLCSLEPVRRQRAKIVPRAEGRVLEIEDASFDCVVVTYTLCSVPDPVTALKEMRRVLKTGGRFLFCEHGRAPDESVRRWQDRLTPYWKNIAGGCHLNRDIAALISEAGFACRDP